MRSQPLDTLPIWLLFLLTVLLFLLAVEAGYRLNQRWRQSSLGKTDVALGGTVGASLALLAFLLAFVVGFGTNVMSERRRLVVAEANAIGTTFLRTSYLAEPYRSEARNLLRELTDLRLAAIDPAQAETAVARSGQIHNQLWDGAMPIAIESPTPTVSLYLSSLNEVIDRHSERIAVGVDIRIPPAVLLGLYLVALFTMFLVGVHSGDGEKRNYPAQIILALILAVVFFLIVDIDRAQEGLLLINQQALIDLQQQLSSSP